MLALILLLAMRAGAGALRAHNPGMTDNPCPAITSPGLEKLRLTLMVIGGEQPRLEDWAGICNFSADNLRLQKAGIRPDTVFIGDSITWEWSGAEPGLFSDRMVNRGIGGQGTPQVLARFYSDVVSLQPRKVHLLIGLNDIAGISGPASFDLYQGNVRSMVEIARANHIAVIIGALPPSRKPQLNGGADPGPQIEQVNRWLAKFAAEEHLVFADYHAALAANDGSPKQGMSSDGTHLTRAAYYAVEPIMQAALAQTNPGPSSQPR